MNPYDAKPWLRFYPEGVSEQVRAPTVPLTRLLDDASDRFPRRKALVFFGKSLTYRQLRAAVDRFAVALSELDVRAGDRVALILPNCPQQVIAFFATLRLGAVVVQHNPLYTAPELHYQLVDSGARIAIVLDRAYETLEAALPATEVDEVIVCSLRTWLPPTKRWALSLPLARTKELREELSTDVPDDAGLDFDALLREARGGIRQARVDPENDLALLQYTGGTTGRPKGVMLTHFNLVANAHQVWTWTRAREGADVTLAVLPIFHAFGLTACMTGPMLAGSTIVLLPRFELSMLLDAYTKWKPTIFPGVPPIYDQIIERAKERSYDFRKVRVLVSGGMPMPKGTAERFFRATRGRLAQGYGMTEASPVAMINPLNGNARHVSVGLPLPSTVARIVHENDPNIVMPVGQAGELMLRGPQVFRGYWNRPEETAVTLRQGWLATGDIAVMSPDGYFTLIDRKSDLIIVDGFNVYPSEVEEVLRLHPSVHDCAVIGIPDRRGGELVKAYVVPAPGHRADEHELLRHCRARLVEYKVPWLVAVRQELPRDMMGAVLRRVLRDENVRRP